MTERKAERVKQLLVRYIRDRQMTNGDKLPPQNELRRIFHYGAATVSFAINALKQDGVLEVRDKVGVFVADPEAGGHAGRIIGITMLYDENNFYYSCLLASLQIHLVENGCTIRLFRCLRKEKIERILWEIDDFPGLRRSIENNEIQGLIHLDDFSHAALDFIKSKKLPLIFVGSRGGIAENGVFFDHNRIVKEACEMLKQKQARRPALMRTQNEGRWSVYALMRTGGTPETPGYAFQAGFYYPDSKKTVSRHHRFKAAAGKKFQVVPVGEFVSGAGKIYFFCAPTGNQLASFIDFKALYLIRKSAASR